MRFAVTSHFAHGDERRLTTAASSPTTVEHSVGRTVEICRLERFDHGSIRASPKIRTLYDGRLTVVGARTAD
jgi:hypothetical protein